MQLSGIQCENCHGPAAQHVQTADKTKLDKSYASEVCAPCHFSSDRHPKGYSWDASGHARSTAEGDELEYMNRSGCAQCHTAQGFVEQTIKGLPEPIVPSGSKLYPETQPVTCAACHDPHSPKNTMQLRRASVGDACTACHTTRVSSRGLHHSHQGSMFLGVESESYNGQTGVGNWSGWELPGYLYENGGHSEIESACVECHMAKTPTYDPTYATPDTLLNRLGGHTFAAIWDKDTPDDESDDIVNPVGCRDCHGEVSLDFVRISQENIKKLLDTLASYLPKDTSNVPLVPARVATQPGKAAAYNYWFVSYDGSFGVHNHTYAKQLLESSIEQMKLGTGAAAIAGVKDVPNDNGRRVQVVWNKFPAENFSFDRLVSYGIWRADPNPVSGKLTSVKNFRDMMTAGPVGTQVTLAGNVWTYVAQVPATGLAQYSYIAPTLADSTVTAGMKWSTFYVAGYSGTGAALYASMPDSGYSVDNLRPVAPSGLVVSLVQNGVRLEWNAAPDQDIDLFNVYRSTTAGFDPAGMTPVAQVKGVEYVDQAVTIGVRYYYRLEAIDLAGNRSPYSPEASIIFTSVRETGGVPTAFGLEQNYPNPFNPSTEIRFALPKATHVTLSVYTISGELVTTLMDDMMAAGTFSITWNGQGSDGTSVSSGLYLYRIQTSEFTAVRKMVLVK
jgi:predicted CXXCH cytochrome family protein